MFRINYSSRIGQTSNGVKKILFLFSLIVFLSLTSTASASQLILPNPLDPVGDFPTLLTNIATYIAGIVGTLAVLMYVWAGILYLTSGTNPGNIQKANQGVFYATIGLAIALSGAGLIALVRNIILGP